METFEREADLQKRAKARGLTMTREGSLSLKYTVEREGIFREAAHDPRQDREVLQRTNGWEVTNNMTNPTPGGQEKKGHRLEKSPPPTRKSGRSDGTGGSQKTIGHLDEESKNAEQKVRPFDGFDGAGRLKLRDGQLTPDDIVSPNQKGDRVGAQPVGEGE
jgi:hypothetical protein